ncbi:hypothetical protein EKL30_14870 [Candidimonas sp. SYP-B2681]|uniref:DUF2231 domain-containing protein n=1 Tax=Candidimonas sp. SYP-B2681 TaxID=2497686 RepID=UPI000F87E440|nr:DUF2231 domain-containing protein [Candidimonas sp. SYP-B2681]RTZ40974.1 hypothetical protein EKL30_14870 [Candidimonas sp. SYP-B2681]
MAITIERRYSRVIHPVHAVLLAGSIPLFLGAALSDAAYASTYEIQWNNFASWLLVGALFFSGFALIFLIVDLFRADRRARGIGVYGVVLLVTWLVGFFDALMHARDAWASMPAGLVLSIIATVLACVATWFGFYIPRIGRTK